MSADGTRAGAEVTPAARPVAGIVARPLRDWAERDAAVRLYRAVFALPAEDPAVSPRLLAGLQRNGGSAVGAFDADELVGFAYGFTGTDGTVTYHYSQAAVVAAGAQGRGVGRLLKYAQADVARATGVRTMRWTYDPLLARNAHFNLDVLGAEGRWFTRDFFDVGALSDAEPAGDRVTVTWPLDAGPPAGPVGAPALPAGIAPPRWGEVRPDGDDLLLGIPADWASAMARDAEAARRVRGSVAEALADALAGDRRLVSCRRVDADLAVYRLRRLR